jgi:hypothetical protein
MERKSINLECVKKKNKENRIKSIEVKFKREKSILYLLFSKNKNKL